MQIQSKEQDRYMLHRIEGEVDLYNSGVLLCFAQLSGSLEQNGHSGGINVHHRR
jgi:hypothetical protein